MAASVGKIGYGTLVKIGDGASPQTFTTIDEVFDVGPVGETTDLVEFTHHESPNRRREWKQGLIDGDEITVQANYLAQNASQTLIRTAFSSATVDNWQVILPDGDETFSFTAITTHWECSPPIDDRQVLSFTLKVSADISVTAYTPT